MAVEGRANDLSTPALHRVADDARLGALRWGFEGWVRTEFDIQADGHTLGARYQSSFRPDGGAACSANNAMVKFMIPNNMGTVSIRTKKKT